MKFSIVYQTDDSESLAYLLLKLEKVRFSKNTASSLIGREALERAVGNGEIRRTRPNDKCQHGKWFCNAADVIRKLITM